jgi:hypothetical protein
VAARQRSKTIAVLIALTLHSRSVAGDGPTLGIVQGTHDFYNEPGCKLWLRTESETTDRYVFVSDYNGNALLNISGHDVHLKLVRSREPKREARKGDRSSYWYKGDDVTVRVDRVVTQLCRPDDENCEIIGSEGTIVVTTRSAKRIVAARGICGS